VDPTTVLSGDRCSSSSPVLLLLVLIAGSRYVGCAQQSGTVPLDPPNSRRIAGTRGHRTKLFPGRAKLFPGSTNPQGASPNTWLVGIHLRGGGRRSILHKPMTVA